MCFVLAVRIRRQQKPGRHWRMDTPFFPEIFSKIEYNKERNNDVQAARLFFCVGPNGMARNL
jgi:hypothetical protein